jgi:catechol-2,3-dioxygenase
MPINRLNHAVLYVRDIERSLEFYRDILGFKPLNMLPEGFRGAAFLQAPGSTNDHDLGLFAIGDAAGPSGAGRSTVGLYHLAWEVDTLSDLADLADKLSAAGFLAGASDHSTTKSLYAKDPDGIELEIAWVVPADKIDESVLAGRSSIQRLDLAKEIDRYGADTRGGIGISHPAGV